MSTPKILKRITLKDAPLHEDLIKRGNYCFKNEYLIARLLLLLADFHKAIHSIQPKIHYKGPWVKLPDKEIEILNAGVNKILLDFYLTPNWRESIVKAVFTSQLNVPPPLNPIFIQSFNDQVSLGFNYKVSITELRKWIKLNKNELEKALSKLPVMPKTKINSKTIFWGQVVALSRLRGLKSNSDIIKDIQNEYVNGKLEGIEDLVGFPDEKDLDNSYKALTNALSKHFKVDTS